MKHINLYEDHDLLRDLNKLGIHEVKWEVSNGGKLKGTDEYVRIERLLEKEERIVNEWSYKNFRIEKIKGVYGSEPFGDHDYLHYYRYDFHVTINSEANKQSTKEFSFIIRIDPTSAISKFNSILIRREHVWTISNGSVEESFEYTKELMEGYDKEPIFPYVLKVFEKIL